MKTIIYLLSFVITCTFPGCSSAVYSYDLKTGKREKRFASSWQDAAFMDTVDDGIKAELKSKKHADSTNWHEYWISRCESLYYDPHLGDAYIQYIIDKRRQAGLPDIPEIDKRQFRSEWQIFTDNVDEQAGREIQGFPPPVIVVDQTWVKTWSDYWEVTKRLALRNPAISTNGVEYIKNQIKQVGFKPLN
jgi:kynurenine formamidase